MVGEKNTKAFLKHVGNTLLEELKQMWWLDDRTSVGERVNLSAIRKLIAYGKPVKNFPDNFLLQHELFLSVSLAARISRQTHLLDEGKYSQYDKRNKTKYYRKERNKINGCAVYLDGLCWNYFNYSFFVAS